VSRTLIPLHEARQLKEPPGLDVVCMADIKPSSITWGKIHDPLRHHGACDDRQHLA
jgi:hypothetical protein